MMKFENKGKWLKEAEEKLVFDNREKVDFNEEDELSGELLAEVESDEDFEEDELDQVEEEQINEVRYIDPSNVDKYDPNDIEEVTTASGEKRYKRKSGTQLPSQTVDKKDATTSKQRVIQNVPDIREGLKMLERDPELSKNYSDFGPSNDMNSGNYIAKNNETGKYEVVGHYNTDNTVTILANNKEKSQEPKDLYTSFRDDLDKLTDENPDWSNSKLIKEVTKKYADQSNYDPDKLAKIANYFKRLLSGN